MDHNTTDKTKIRENGILNGEQNLAVAVITNAIKDYLEYVEPADEAFLSGKNGMLRIWLEIARIEDVDDMMENIKHGIL